MEPYPASEEEVDFHERRGFHRVALAPDQIYPLVLVREDGQCLQAVLMDISIGGARVRLRTPSPQLEEGEMLLLEHCAMDPFCGRMEGMHAQLVWRHGNQAGLLFETLLE
ncbi:putative type IV pilus assembly PilZ [Megalodesulfovibrio gigas DSM 1382 = ATCC 19364]|uniref:Putative type IV pilus assembly PilZ n=1 Tax=Megalodesulfovibrio gigas (strain ATCC 19364 / DSM 1382 / NCIMB 9332 / VKM B-1759) TaxID=1121448 RepID=T2GD48_MEGG1|nr:putative type IV pilus assembly PilZ [Megalodesulfovibrio gigas DSM 1382 = ATCC 19364]